MPPTSCPRAMYNKGLKGDFSGLTLGNSKVSGVTVGNHWKDSKKTSLFDDTSKKLQARIIIEQRF